MMEEKNFQQSDWPKFVDSLERKAANGDILACVTLSMIYEDGTYFDKNELKAIEYLEKAASFGSKVAQECLTERYGKNIKE